MSQSAVPESVSSRIIGSVSALTVVAALAGFAWFGHHTDWTFSWGAPSHKPTVEPDMAGIPGGVRFASAEAFDRSGIDFDPVRLGKITDAIDAPGELSLPAERTARVTSRSAGVAQRVLHKVGDRVRAGESLAIIDSPAAGQARSAYRLAVLQARYAQESLIEAKRSESPVARIQEAEAENREAQLKVEAAKSALGSLGLPANLGEQGSALPVVSPLEGEVIACDVVAGETVDPSKPLFSIADARRLSLTLHVAPADAARLSPGLKVEFAADGGATSEAVIRTLDPTAEAATRTIAVRCDVANEQLRLRANGLGRGRIIVRELPNAIVIPATALQQVNGQAIVLVRDPNFLTDDSAKIFRSRTVKSGVRDGVMVEIISGLKPDEVVATVGSARLAAIAMSERSTP